MANPANHENRFLEIIAEIVKDGQGGLSLDSPLMSGNNPVDSVTLVEICVRLEDLATELGFDFDWMSENAMSRSRSVFHTVGTLFDEFSRQMNQA